ncbi:antibiotic biosynthesis monooxygenase [Phreatobacter stygius]|uniref:Antibiotic biosynthesis monooxygenase n=1 Tax=Phreatobacter stygius TaxID=1940610 RepID=A0A4D7B142_9HYPH|nr:antibiotic biosynthesis monooxygenase [Phreatobacter stygius]QCI64683.1 antibiotic biosynthesis monooxygenase [Phreatobacter stygius]
MIARIWRGFAASPEAADAYQAFLRDSFLPAAARLAGFAGVHVLRRTLPGGEIEFTTITRFASLDAVRAFAGDDYEIANVAPRARALLAHFQTSCSHHDVVLTETDLA